MRHKTVAEQFVEEVTECGAVLPCEVAEIAVSFLTELEQRSTQGPDPFELPDVGPCNYEPVPAGEWAECEQCRSQFEIREALTECHGYCPNCAGTSWYGITQRRVPV